MNVVPAAGFSHDALAECFTLSFDGYIAGSMKLDAAMLPRFLARQGADLALSRCVTIDGVLMGLGFIGAYAGRRRVGGMGVRPEARGTGAARMLMARLIDDAKAAGADALELEVFSQNLRAVRLYRSLGFAEGVALRGFSREAGAPVPQLPALLREGAPPQPVSLADAAEWLMAHGRADLPYQASAHALRHVDASARAWRLGSALLVFSVGGPELVTIQVLFDADPRQLDAQRLLAALVQAHASHAMRVPQLMREDCAGQALRNTGFKPLDLHQIQMRLALA